MERPDRTLGNRALAVQREVDNGLTIKRVAEGLPDGSILQDWMFDVEEQVHVVRAHEGKRAEVRLSFGLYEIDGGRADFVYRVDLLRA